MSFYGHKMEQCHIEFFKYKEFHVVIVSGDGFNKCAHALLNVGGSGGYYFQVAGSPYAYPLYMNHLDYLRYLRESDKKELFRQHVFMPNPNAALLEIETILNSKWFWRVLWHNCATFVEQIVKAGGGHFRIPMNCPVLAIPE